MYKIEPSSIIQMKIYIEQYSIVVDIYSNNENMHNDILLTTLAIAINKYNINNRTNLL